MKKLLVRILFILAAVYDGLLGLVFLFMSPDLFKCFGVTPPNHFGYVHFPAALLILFALMFAAVAVNPARNRNLILCGVGLKTAYCGVVLFHWLKAGLPAMWTPFFYCDLVFLALFAWAWLALAEAKEKTEKNL
jgi:hypothetical protein